MISIFLAYNLHLNDFMTLRNKRVHPTYKYPICIREISEYFISSRPSYLYERYGQTTQFRSAKRDTHIWYQDFVLSFQTP